MIERPEPARRAHARWRCSPTGPIASRPAKCRRRRRGRRASSATSSSRSGTGPTRRRTCTTRSPPTGAIRRVNANGPLYGALELSADYLPVLDPVTHTASRVPLTVRDPNTPRVAAPTMPQPSPYWGDEVDLDQQEQRAQPDVRRARPRVDHLGGAPARQPRRSARKARLIRRRSCSRFNGAGRHLADVRPEDAEAHAHQHVLRHASPDVRRGRQQHAVDERRRAGRRLAEHEDVRRDRRRGEVAGLDRAHHRHERQRQARRVRRAERSRSIRRRTSGSAAAFYARRAGARRLGLGLGARLPGRGHPARARRESAARRRSRKSTSRR